MKINTEEDRCGSVKMIVLGLFFYVYSFLFVCLFKRHNGVKKTKKKRRVRVGRKKWRLKGIVFCFFVWFVYLFLWSSWFVCVVVVVVVG